jgi:hypothetical protein
MSRRGLLLTMTEPPPAMEEEFNAWYDREHLPERLSIPGFRSARRWVADCDASAVVPVFGANAPSLPSTLQVRTFAAAAREPRQLAICELAGAGVVLPAPLRIYRAYVA